MWEVYKLEVNDLRGLRNNFWFVCIPHARNEEHDVVGPMGGTTSASVWRTVCVLKCSSTVAYLQQAKTPPAPCTRLCFLTTPPYVFQVLWNKQENGQRWRCRPRRRYWNRHNLSYVCQCGCYGVNMSVSSRLLDRFPLFIHLRSACIIVMNLYKYLSFRTLSVALSSSIAKGKGCYGRY